ncbi:MAG: protein kinase domain-containing protein [Gemmatimonadales bacterium]
MTSDPVAELRTGLLDRYAFERELGRGGMAVVYLARDLRHDRPVALKVLHADLATTLGPDRFQREIRLAARLQHPHILTVLDSGETAGRFWFTMPYVEGESLRDRLRRERQLPVDEALRIAREAAQALQYAHDQGVIHRDIKPENLLLTRDGNTLVADFGIARALGAEADDRLTNTGLAIGTPAYMSPEQAAGDRNLDARTDVYALGAVLYEMLAGEPPYTGATTQALIVKRLTEPPPSVRAVRSNVPEPVDAAIRRALAPVPADRFAGAAEFARAIVAPAAGATTTVVPAPAATPPRPSRPRVPAAALALMIGLLIGAGILFAWRRNHSEEAPGSAGHRIAVLPFQNLGDSSTAYFADGITDAVRGKLAAVPGVQVIASGSANEYKGTSKTLGEIGRELDSDYLLVARVRWAKTADGSSRVEVSPELVDVSPGHPPTTKWQQPFEAAITDVFKVQGEIAGQVASALDLALGAGQREAMAKRPTRNLAAYDAYLKAEATGGLVAATAQTLRPAIVWYGQAVGIDSTFAEAWSRLSRAQGLFYLNVMPSPEADSGARRAAERAAALAPDSPAAHFAWAGYYLTTHVDNARALSEAQAGLRVAPNNTDLLIMAALSEQGLGQWDSSVAYLQRAAVLDPRSVTTQRRLAHGLLRLHRLPEAELAADRALALAPANLDAIEAKVMVHLASGDLDGARAALDASRGLVDPTTLAVFLGTYWDLYWVLDDAQQQLLLRQSPSAFDGDEGTWGIVLAQTAWLRGDRARARALADTARAGFVRTLEGTPTDPQRTVILALALAYAGQKPQALETARRAEELIGTVRDDYTVPYLRHVLARIYVLTGERDKAVDQLEKLLARPYFATRAWLRIDPSFAPLKGYPRFDKLVASGNT